MRLSRVLAFAAVAAVPMFGTSVTYQFSGTATASSGSSGAVNAKVQITTGDGSIVLTIWNQQLGINRDVQAISAVTFVVNSAATNLGISNRDGLVRTLNANGTYSDASTRFTDAIYDGRWILGATTTSTSTSLDINAFGGGSPNLTIVGAPNSNNLYQDAQGKGPNKAVTGHNPYLATDAAMGAAGAVTFRIAATGVTSATTISQVAINFGTDRTATYAAIISSPEPGAAGMGLAGLGLLFAVRRWKHRK